MKKIVLKTYGKTIAYILGLFGVITGCINPMYGTPAPEYGVPHADFVIKGKVTDAETSEPIPKIGIVHTSGYSESQRDTVYSDVNGEYELRYGDFPDFSKEKMVIAVDVDEEVNNLYKTDTLSIRFSEKDRTKTGKGNWYEGTFEKTNQDFKLEKEKQ